MTGKERMLKTLRFEEPDRPPHFETMFELEKEAFNMQFPDRRSWGTCSKHDKEIKIEKCMQIYDKIIHQYNWDALAVYWPWSDPDGVIAAKKNFGQDTLIGSIVGGTIWSIESISDWNEFAIMLMEEPHKIHKEAEVKTEQALKTCDALIDAGADFILLVNDVAFNYGPFISPKQFNEFVTPYLFKQVQYIKKRGSIPFVHSDGDITPLLDDYLSLGAACFQSVDPMAGMDIAETKKRCYGKMTLMGNVQCNIMQDGPNEAIKESALYCLEHASPGGGYIFSTSNTIYPNMPLKHYEYMLEVFHDFNIKS